MKSKLEVEDEKIYVAGILEFSKGRVLISQNHNVYYKIVVKLLWLNEMKK